MCIQIFVVLARRRVGRTISSSLGCFLALPFNMWCSVCSTCQCRMVDWLSNKASVVPSSCNLPVQPPEASSEDYEFSPFSSLIPACISNRCNFTLSSSDSIEYFLSFDKAASNLKLQFHTICSINTRYDTFLCSPICWADRYLWLTVQLLTHPLSPMGPSLGGGP